jgi:ketopantoate hydroxymethyltransferase
MAPKAQQPQREKITILKLYEMKARGEPVSWLTCYDYPTALLMDRAGIDIILVGDSLGMTMRSGKDVDGQLMIVHDMIGMFERFTPKFVKRYVNLSPILLEAFSKYREEVKSGQFPQPEHFYSMAEGELEKLLSALKRRRA